MATKEFKTFNLKLNILFSLLLFLILNNIIFTFGRPLDDDEGIIPTWKMRTDKKAMRNSLVRFGKRSSSNVFSPISSSQFSSYFYSPENNEVLIPSRFMENFISPEISSKISLIPSDSLIFFDKTGKELERWKERK
ncbi:hypothetical protein ACQ4LE_004747 [Meloidogyne hapla]